MIKKSRIMKWVLWYVTVIIVAVFLYFIGWIFLWCSRGQPDIVELRSFVNDVVSAPWIAMIGVVAQYFVDRNKDNIPDILEREEEEEDSKVSETSKENDNE